MELIQQFGIDWKLLIAQAINFLVIMYILKRFLYKPILEVLKNRENVVKKGLEQAADAAKMYEEATEKEKAILKKAQSEAKKLLEDANQQRIEMLTKAEESTKKQVEQMLSEGRAQIAEDVVKAQKDLRGDISKIASELLEKSLTGFFTEKEQADVMKNATKKIKTID